MTLFSKLLRRLGLQSNRTEAELFANVHGPGTYELDIVGESHYQNALAKICGGHTEDGHRMVVEALLMHEDENPHDHQAVAVAINGNIVGYLSRKMARQFRRRMAEAGAAGVPAVCSAIIVGGWDRGDGDVGHFGVKLDLPMN